MDKFLKIFNGIVKSVNEEKRTVSVIVSNETRDADGDVILKTAFKKHLGRYKKNPVLLNSHNYRDVQNVLGKALSIKVTDEGLLVEFQYFTGKGNAAADWAFELIKQGIAAFSIGFVGKEYEYIEEKIEGVNRITGRKFKEVELLEISQVTVPSNPDAVLEARNLKSVEEELLDKAEKAFKNGTLKEISGEKEEPNQTEEKNNETTAAPTTLKSVYEELLFGGPEPSSQGKSPEEKKTVPAITKFKVNAADLEKTVKESLK